MLVHHADPGGQRRLRLAGRERAPEHLDRPGVGDVVAEQDIHQRALAGAVLAQQAQHLAARELERDGVVGDQRAEALGDAGEAENGLLQGLARPDPVERQAVLVPSPLAGEGEGEG